MKQPNFKSGTIYTGDNLLVMRGMNSETVDLIYLDPPFNSNRNYSAPVGSKAAGAAFKDMWTLDDIDVYEHGELAEKNPAAYEVIKAAGVTHSKGMMSYLIFMAVRLIEMRRILKENGSIYLHCDPTASHYLKLLMDATFGRKNFQNEIIWAYNRFSRKGDAFAAMHDSIIFYTKTNDYIFNKPTTEAKNQERYKKGYHTVTDRGKTRLLVYDEIKAVNKIVEAKKLNRSIKYTKAVQPTMGTVWNDIAIINPQAKERTGYPTQKPLALLKRIIQASSNRGDLVFDPFCGCATTLVAADQESRQWIGCDLSPKAVELVDQRIKAETVQRPELWGEVNALNEPPKRTDLGKIPNYRTHAHRLYGEQEGICKGCDIHFPFKAFAVDHILPKSRGGTDHMDNLQLLCPHCNSSKKDKTMAEWEAWKKKSK